MPSGHREYLSGPEPRRWAPWLLVAGLALAAVAGVYELDVLGGVIALLLGAGVGAQAIDAVRTGYLVGRFPNKWPIDASRRKEPFTFWLTVVVYGATGLLFVALGLSLLTGG